MHRGRRVAFLGGIGGGFHCLLPQFAQVEIVHRAPAAGLDVQPGHLAVQVEVANTGARFAGREVAQVYLSAPQGELPRERRRLAGFAKTRRLAPGETQTLTLEIPQKQLAAFHPEQNAWVVDAGLYGV